MSVNFGPGFHTPARALVDGSAYDRYVGLWSSLFVPNVLAAAGAATGHRLLDIATGPGEASMALRQIGPSAIVVGADISLEMLHAGRTTCAVEQTAGAH